MKMKMELELRELEYAFPETNKAWLFLKHDDKHSSYDMRWIIGWRKKNGWWGVIASFPATHEGAITTVKDEMILAKKAIRKLKRLGAHKKVLLKLNTKGR